MAIRLSIMSEYFKPKSVGRILITFYMNISRMSLLHSYVCCYRTSKHWQYTTRDLSLAYETQSKKR
jgi:hypothetical protein